MGRFSTSCPDSQSEFNLRGDKFGIRDVGIEGEEKMVAGAKSAADRWRQTMSERLPIVQEYERGAYAAMAEVIRTSAADAFATATVPVDSRHARFSR